jgi:hypothetical protein
MPSLKITTLAAIAIVLATALSCPGFAQDSVAQPVSAAAPLTVGEMQASAPLTLREGTILKVSTLDMLSSKISKQGDIFRMKLDEDLKIDNITVLPSGTIAYGTITYAQPRRMLGQAGELYYRVDYLQLGEQRIKIRTSRSAQGKDSTGSTIALVALFGVFGALKKGKDTEVPVGTGFEVYVSESTIIGG